MTAKSGILNLITAHYLFVFEHNLVLTSLAFGTLKVENMKNKIQREGSNIPSCLLALSAALTVLTVASGFAVLPSSASTPFVNSNVRKSGSSLYLYIDTNGQSSQGPSSTETTKTSALNDDETMLSQSPPSEDNSGGTCGTITLVGSGPGDPDLLTVAAYRLISDPSAFLVVDRLVSPEILALIQGEYKIARKLPGCADKAQNEIYDWCEEALKQGKNVIRLKIGDPFVFGRGGEEVLKFRSMGYEPKVIPGVSAAFAAPLLGSIPVTHRGVSNQVVMCTGYGRDGTSPDLIRYHPEQTVVFLMAVGRLQELCNNLIKMAGYPSKTPVAIVEKAGCPEQRTLVGNMEDIADLAQEYAIKPPSTIVVGEVVNVLLGEDGREAAHGLVDKKCTELSMVIEGN